MASVKAIIKKHKANKENLVPIVIRISHNGQNTTMALKKYIDPKYWNVESDKSKVRKNHPNST